MSYFNIGDHHYLFDPIINQHAPSADIDECLLGTSGCERLCNNTQGSYTCSCPAGYTLFEGEDVTLVANHSCVCKLTVFLVLSCRILSGCITSLANVLYLGIQCSVPRNVNDFVFCELDDLLLTHLLFETPHHVKGVYYNVYICHSFNSFALLLNI